MREGHNQQRLGCFFFFSFLPQANQSFRNERANVIFLVKLQSSSGVFKLPDNCSHNLKLLAHYVFESILRIHSLEKKQLWVCLVLAHYVFEFEKVCWFIGFWCALDWLSSVLTFWHCKILSAFLLHHRRHKSLLKRQHFPRWKHELKHGHI